MRAPKRLVVAAVFLLLAGTATGCANLPESSSPEAIGTVAAPPNTSTAIAPVPGRDPDLLLRNFLQASTSPSGRHATARMYLTAERAQNWDDAASTTIIDAADIHVDSRSDTSVSFTVRGHRVGQLASGGIYVPQDGDLSEIVTFRKVDGQWRISDIPDGVVLERGLFDKAYRNSPLYFLDPSGNRLAPDPRWISAAPDQVASQLLGLLGDGPRSGLRGAVLNRFGDGVALRSPLTKADGRPGGVGVGVGGVRIDMQGVGNLGSAEREQLAAQLIWTLASAAISGPYQLLVDGQPLDSAHTDGWSTSDVAKFSPDTFPGANLGLYAVRDGSLVSVKENSVVPAPGFFGSGARLQSVGLSNDGSFVAGVVPSGRIAPDPPLNLIVGTYLGGSAPFPVDSGSAISRPSWMPDDSSVWAVIDGIRVIRVVTKGGVATREDVDATAVAALGHMSELRISRDGVRAALIIDGRVVVAVVSRNPNGTYALLSPVQLPVGPGVQDAVTLDWATGGELIVVRRSADAPVVRMAVDGSWREPLPVRNLALPVTALAASPTADYLADARAVQELVAPTDSSSEHYWREVPALIGTRAIPVIPG